MHEQAPEDGLMRTSWDQARHRAAAGDIDAARFVLWLVVANLGIAEKNGRDGPVATLPLWFVHELMEIFSDAHFNKKGLDEVLHLNVRPGRNRFSNEQRDELIRILSYGCRTNEALADKVQEHGVPPPTPGGIWTADSVAKALAAAKRRIKDGYFITGIPKRTD